MPGTPTLSRSVGGATPVQPVSGILAVYNVKDYGAKGDGVTDDTTALGTAISAASAANGILFWSPGTYVISSALTVPNNSWWFGGGADNGGTIIKQTNTAANALSATDLIVFMMQGIGLLGPSSGTGKGINFVFSTHNANSISIRDCRINHFGSDGVHIEQPVVCNLERVVSLNNGGHGFYLGQSVQASGGTSTSVNACYANTNGQAGYYLQKLQYSSFNGCASDSNGVGYYLDTCIAISLNGCGTESNTAKGGFNGNGFVVSGGRSSSIRSCFLNAGVGGATPNVWVTGSATSITVEGFTDSGTAPTNSVQFDAGSTGSIKDITCQGSVSYPSGVDILAGGLLPSDLGLKAMNFPPDAAVGATTTALTSGTIYLFKVHVPVPSVITNIVLYLSTIGATLTAGQSLVGLYSASTGAQLGVSADQSAVFAGTTGLKTIALGSPVAVAAGYYYVALLSVGTTPPAFARGAGINILNGALGSSSYRYATNGTAQTTLPGTFTLSSNAAQTIAYWVGLS